MAKVHFLLLALLFFAAVLGRNKAEAKFVETTHFTWGAHHSSILDTGDDIELVMDKQSGSAFQSENAYLFGSVEMMIKLVPGNSAGTVTAFYLSSLGDRHDEIDFEFLGSVVEKYYIVHTNIFTQGKGDREQEFFLWFDPTADFHNYTIHWNPSKVVWYVDGIPIRVFRNYEKQGIAFPSKQGMRMYGSLWNADWATDAGRIKIDWRFAPFKAWFRNFRARACTWKGPASTTHCTLVTPANWYTSPAYSQLSVDEQGQMKQVRDKYMIYDYCKDGPRFNGSIPPECSNPQ